MRTTVVAALFIVGGCGGGGGDSLPPTAIVTPPTPDPTGLWVQSEDDGAGLSSYALTLTEIAVTRAVMADVALESAPTADAGSNGGFSTTYTLESSVDEYDIVKYNGSILALAPSRSGCCYVIEPLAASSVLPAPNEDPSAHNIELFVTDPESGSASLAGIIELDGDENTEGMYLSENRLQALISTAWWGTFGDRLTTSDG
ncbi:MAG: beta-propeller domain-containing protein, partial [Luminiphilus sp.]|nr:beta-propeller domain-containing protein [Luminiphilus sp.]